MRPCLALIFLCSSPLLFAQDAPPRSLDDRLEISLFAEDPLLNTPTGIDVDSNGRVWVIESNTHFPPEDYKGHPTDRLLILEDTDGDGKAEAKTFIDGFTHSMSVAVKPVWLDPVLYSDEKLPGDIGPPTQVFLATRREIFLLEDTDGDDQCDKQTSLVRLETEGNYPHNGLAGFTFDALGNMYFGFGENLGADYKIIGRDGTTYSGGGEGGNIYQVQPDGTKLKHWATGFWNPHANCVDAFGRLFSVDNDPDSLPPCRLLHIIEGGDYGYRYRNGRKGFHPFTCWNGEIPGTLPMVAGTGEAPSGILAYEHDAFPEEYLGNLIVTSWGDHRIDRFRLKPKGASFESVAEPFIVGGENFRPVGIALAPDGSLYLSDWVLREYKVHGKGRVWRIKAKNAPQNIKAEHKTLEDRLNSAYLPERRLAARDLADQSEGREKLTELLARFDAPVRSRIEALWAIAQVPKSVQNFHFLEKRDERRIAGGFDEVGVEVHHLVGKTEQFPAVTDNRLIPFRSVLKVEQQPPLRDFPDRQRLEFLISEIIASPPNDYLMYSGSALRFSDDPFVVAQLRLAIQSDTALFREFVITALTSDDLQKATRSARRTELARAAWLLAARDIAPREKQPIELALRLNSNLLKRLSIQWIAEEHLNDLRPQVEALFNDPDLTPDLFLATLAALEMLGGKPPAEFDKTPPGKYVLPILTDDTKPANVKAIALRLVDPMDPELEPNLVRKLTESDNPLLRQEAIRTAAMNPRGTDYCGLLKAVNNDAFDINLRAEALVGMARRVEDSVHARGLVKSFAKGDNHILAREALRTLREKSNERPVEPFPVEGKPDPQAGRRLFFHPQGPGCFKCHTVEGRGGKIGPDLSRIGGALSREKLMESIRKPSQEVAPQFTTWTMISTAGKTYTGMIVHENKGDTVLGLKDGTTVQLKTADVEERSPQKTSVMPEKMEQQMTEREFEDLIAFLESLR